jgi:hypothetical protein
VKTKILEKLLIGLLRDKKGTVSGTSECYERKTEIFLSGSLSPSQECFRDFAEAHKNQRPHSKYIGEGSGL